MPAAGEHGSRRCPRVDLPSNRQPSGRMNADVTMVAVKNKMRCPALIPQDEEFEVTAMMTGKRQSSTGCPEPDLGQKAAELEKVSETRLRHMKGSRATSAPGRFIAWCKQEQASIQQQLELMETGKVRTGEDIGAGWIDTTAESIERAKARLAELNDLLTEAGKATVIKPDAL
jgi:hypothetical protein